MRILISTFSRNMVGGVETYLRTIMPALLARRHEVVLFHELAFRAGIDVLTPGSEGLRTVSVAETGREQALVEVRHFAPEVVYQHGVLDPRLEEKLLGIAPAMLFAHAYYGTCISGTKRFLRPRVAPCTRELGPACLLLYAARGCGGKNPARMLREFSLQTARRRMLSRYAGVAVASEHMSREMKTHGVSARVLRLPLMLRPDEMPPVRRRGPAHRILFAGRMTREKGVRLLAQAAEIAGNKLGRALNVRFAGTGPEEQWVRARQSSTWARLEPLGWLTHQALQAEMRAADLFAMPSIWPEPFGLSGVEAGAVGLPSVAYRVGGIPEWCRSGTSGELAELGTAPAEAFAEAIVRAIGSEAHWNELRMGAWTVAREFDLDAHVDALERALREVASTRPARSVGAA